MQPLICADLRVGTWVRKMELEQQAPRRDGGAAALNMKAVQLQFMQQLRQVRY